MAQFITLVFVHGWSVTDTDAYGGLPDALAAAAEQNGLTLSLQHVYLGRYISFHDEVTLDDIARAFDYALRNDIPDNKNGAKVFSCVTHSTGGPIVRRWVDMFYGANRLTDCPLRHLVMLAPANHGSALAIIGKARIGRIKAWFGGVEPGEGVLDWLSLGSDGAWSLSDSFTSYKLQDRNFNPFALSGETIDEAFYDFLNSYLTEKGSDGVVRLAAANLNYSFIRLKQTEERHDSGTGPYILAIQSGPRQRSPATAFRVVPNASHSGEDIGIMRSVTPENAANKPVVAEIITCLKVESSDDYARVVSDFDAATQSLQGTTQVKHYAMFVFRVRDDEGRTISDYEILLLGEGFKPGTLPKGFFIDRQKNPKSQSLVYYLDYDILSRTSDLGIRVQARPSFGEPGKAPEAFAGYLPAEIRFSGRQLKQAVRPNETVYVDICLTRYVATGTMRLDPYANGKGPFKDAKPESQIPVKER